MYLRVTNHRPDFSVKATKPANPQPGNAIPKPDQSIHCGPVKHCLPPKPITHRPSLRRDDQASAGSPTQLALIYTNQSGATGAAELAKALAANHTLQEVRCAQ